MDDSLGHGLGISAWREELLSFRSEGHLNDSLHDSNLAAAPKNPYQTGTLVSENMGQNLRNPSCFILSHTHFLVRAGVQTRCILVAEALESGKEGTARTINR